MKKLRTKNQQYDAWLHWDITKRCNLDCEYCFGKITDSRIRVYSIDIPKLLKTLYNTGKTFRISFTGGEPTLVPNFVKACVSITEKHFISFNTNLISKNIKQFAESVNPKRVLHIHASFHYDELVKNNLLNHFIKNYNMLKSKGFNIYAEAVAYPKLLNEVDEIKEFAKRNLLEFSFAPFIGKYEGKEYPFNYSNNELLKFNLNNNDIFCYAQQGGTCNAGYNAAVVFSNRNVYPCHQIKRKIGNIYEGIEFDASPVKCPAKKCGCPLNKYDEYLFNRATTNCVH